MLSVSIYNEQSTPLKKIKVMVPILFAKGPINIEDKILDQLNLFDNVHFRSINGGRR